MLLNNALYFKWASDQTIKIETRKCDIAGSQRSLLFILKKETMLFKQISVYLSIAHTNGAHLMRDQNVNTHRKKKLLKNRLCGVIICRIRVNNYIWIGNWMWMVFDHCNDTKTQLKQFSFSIGLDRLPRFVIHANDECFGNLEYCRHNLNGICKPCLIPFSKLDRSQDKLKQ